MKMDKEMDEGSSSSIATDIIMVFKTLGVALNNFLQFFPTSHPLLLPVYQIPLSYESAFS